MFTPFTITGIVTCLVTDVNHLEDERTQIALLFTVKHEIVLQQKAKPIE